MPAPEGYVDVAQRIREFYERFPEGSLQTSEPQLFHVGDKTFVAVAATAWRTPDDKRPGVGSAWEPVPGPTPFTRDSELQNAETSAWGRAIVALGFETKHIASAEEVRNRQPAADGAAPATPESAAEKPHTPGQMTEMKLLLKLLNDSFPEHPGDGRRWEDEAKGWANDHADGKRSDQLSQAEMNDLIRWLEDRFNNAVKEQAVPFS